MTAPLYGFSERAYEILLLNPPAIGGSTNVTSSSMASTASASSSSSSASVSSASAPASTATTDSRSANQKNTSAGFAVSPRSGIAALTVSALAGLFAFA